MINGSRTNGGLFCEMVLLIYSMAFGTFSISATRYVHVNLGLLSNITVNTCNFQEKV